MSTISAVVLRGGRWCRWSADHRHRTIATAPWLAAIVLTGASAGSCTGGVSPTALPVALERLVSDRAAPSIDSIEVWICDVPAVTADPLYGDLPLRLALDPTVVTGQIADRTSDYFATISHGLYNPSFSAGATIEMSEDDTAETCLDAALDRSSPTATVVLAVATAEHVAGISGGWGRPGSWFECSTDCAARTTRRAAYVGASDFNPDWGAVPLLDLIEHEIGHTLGLPHSGIDPDDGSYLSGLDLMSDSAAPRHHDQARRDAPDTLAINRLDLGWLSVADIEVISTDTNTETDFALSPSAGVDGRRLAVIELDAHRVISIEFLAATGFDDHFEHSGVAVHLIDDRPGDRELRLQQPLGAGPPHLHLLQAGDELEVEGWRVRVNEVGATARVAVTAANR